MAITGKLYGTFFKNCAKKLINVETDALHVTLHTASYVPDQDAHEFVSSLTNEVATAGGYTAGGIVLTSKVLNYTPATNKLTLQAANVSWPTSTITASVVVISDRTPGTAATQPLMVYQLSDTPIVSSGGPFDVQWNASGIWELTAA